MFVLVQMAPQLKQLELVLIFVKLMLLLIVLHVIQGTHFLLLPLLERYQHVQLVHVVVISPLEVLIITFILPVVLLAMLPVDPIVL